MGNKCLLSFVVGAMAYLIAMTPPPISAQRVAISDSSITIADEEVLTMEHATPVYARGTGNNNPANRLVKVGGTVLVSDQDRGLTLTILDAATHNLVSSMNYDTWYFPSSSDALAGALRTLRADQIGIITSADAFETNITSSLREEARRLGLNRLAASESSSEPSTWRHPYAAIFHGASSPTSNRQAVEILQQNVADAPYAVLATWLIDDGFVGQGEPAGIGQIFVGGTDQLHDLVPGPYPGGFQVLASAASPLGHNLILAKAKISSSFDRELWQCKIHQTAGELYPGVGIDDVETVFPGNLTGGQVSLLGWHEQRFEGREYSLVCRTAESPGYLDIYSYARIVVIPVDTVVVTEQ